MRTFDHVDDKLIEADFFINKMSEEEIGWFEMRCYFSAFVSSARSVTFALQASMNGIKLMDLMSGIPKFKRTYDMINLRDFSMNAEQIIKRLGLTILWAEVRKMESGFFGLANSRRRNINLFQKLMFFPPAKNKCKRSAQSLIRHT